MARILNARETEDGIKYRFWSTNGDEYFTEEMDEEEARNLLLWWAIQDAMESINNQVSWAKEHGEGTKHISQFSRRESTKDPWFPGK